VECQQQRVGPSLALETNKRIKSSTYSTLSSIMTCQNRKQQNAKNYLKASVQYEAILLVFGPHLNQMCHCHGHGHGSYNV
jgi:hypothetical protein